MIRYLVVQQQQANRLRIIISNTVNLKVSNFPKCIYNLGRRRAGFWNNLLMKVAGKQSGKRREFTKGQNYIL